MYAWLGVQPFGKPVVPEVYWMLMRSSGPTTSASKLEGDSPSSSARDAIPGPAPSAQHGDRLKSRHATPHGREPAGFAGSRQRHPRPRVGEHVTEVGFLVLGVEGDHHRPDLRQRHPARGELDPVGDHQGDAVALADLLAGRGRGRAGCWPDRSAKPTDHEAPSNRKSSRSGSRRARPCRSAAMLCQGSTGPKISQSRSRRC